MIYAIGVDTSVAFSKNIYYFRYKGVDFKYVPHYKNGETDDLVCKIPEGSSQEGMYELMTEFLSAFAFANNAKVIVCSGIVSQVDAKLNNVNIRFFAKRSINVCEGMDEFCTISLLRTPEQIQLARLYREAFCSNNIYFKILFFWHCLVYPNADEAEGVKYIDQFAGNLPQGLSYMRDNINNFVADKIFLHGENTKDVSVGGYIKDSIRHSIAHIVRRPGYGIDLKLDSWKQTRHLHDIGAFMQVAAKYRLENQYDMKASNDMAIFRYINEDDLQ